MKIINVISTLSLSIFCYSIDCKAANDLQPDADRNLFYHSIGNVHLAPGVSSISLLVGEELNGELHDVIVTIVSRQDEVTSHLKSYFGFEGEQIASQITLSDYIDSNVSLSENKYICRSLSVTKGEVSSPEGSVKERFRVVTQGNDRPNKNSLYCIGFNLVGGNVQIFDFNSIRERFCPQSVTFSNDPRRIFYKNRFSKLILNKDAIRAVRKALSDQMSGKPITNYGFERRSHGYAMVLLEEANIDFPQYIGGWTPDYKYFLVNPMESFIVKITYTESKAKLKYYSGSANRKKLREILGFVK